MKCKETKILMMELLYNEISEKNKTKLQKHLDSCPQCLTEFDELYTVPSFLEKWEDEKSPIQISFSEDEKSIFDLLNNLIPSFNIIKKTGFAFATILLMMAVFNTKIEFKDNSFSFETSLARNKSESVSQFTFTPVMLEQIRYENYKLTSQLLESYQAKNDKQTLLLMNNLVAEIRNERKQEFNNLVGTVNKAYNKNDMRIRQTNLTVDEIMRLMQQARGQK